MQIASGIDLGFLTTESEQWRMHVAGVIVCEPGPDGLPTERLLRRLAARLPLAPQFRRRLDPVASVLHPVWIDDPSFRLDAHVRRVALPGSGDRQAFNRLVGNLVGMPIERDRPPWDLWIVEGLAGGEVALVARMHHAIIDGVSAAALAALLFDITADADLNDPATDAPNLAPLPEPPVGDRLAVAARAAAARPRHAARLMSGVLRQAGIVARHAADETIGALPFGAPRTPWDGPISGERSFASTALDAAELAEVAAGFGVTSNDAVLATVTGALRTWLGTVGLAFDVPLVAQVPVSRRAGRVRQGEGTKVGAMFVPLPVHLADPAERVAAVADGTRTAKALRAELQAVKRAELTDAVPPALLGLSARLWRAAGMEGRLPPPCNAVVSNVPGPKVPLYVAGARVRSMVPLGPLIPGCGLNLTVLGYDGAVDVGVLTCRRLLAEPAPIADAMVDELKVLRIAAGA